MANFDFLKGKPEFSILYGPCADAEGVFDFPGPCCAACRRALEASVKWIFKAEALETRWDSGDDLVDLLNNSGFRALLPPATMARLHRVRKRGNRGAHKNDGNEKDPRQQDALDSLKDLFEFVSWIDSRYSSSGSPYKQREFKPELLPRRVDCEELEKYKLGYARKRKAYQAKEKELAERKTEVEELRKELERVQKLASERVTREELEKQQRQYEMIVADYEAQQKEMVDLAAQTEKLRQEAERAKALADERIAPQDFEAYKREQESRFADYETLQNELGVLAAQKDALSQELERVQTEMTANHVRPEELEEYKRQFDEVCAELKRQTIALEQRDAQNAALQKELEAVQKEASEYRSRRERNERERIFTPRQITQAERNEFRADILEFSQERNAGRPDTALVATLNKATEQSDADFAASLVDMYTSIGLQKPYEGDFDSFMSCPSNQLVFR